ncbi:hypothetical protein BSZ35_13215 [Salinibacter sp. 10B]|uniref:sigma-70 family RNA polymerase sigma factor n=1 Tax=Salinibacter sp. 10B TaxID=1923971 RepID=UPI000CF4B1DA|nr:sigma-70 family RNA polymerase sigma factor [Salinibacter sp. 10B]PQJ35435.1 hypothetical protein BSZ35_13215 [Salinibacter sp. 10B]
MNTPESSSHSDTAVWRPFVDGLRSFIGRRVPTADAEDVLQDTLLRLHEGTDSLRNADRAEAWVFSIARRAIADYFRQEERRPVDTSVNAPTVETPPSSENLAPYDGDHDPHEEVLSWLRPMAEELPEMYRRPLLMADFEGYTQQAVADEIGLSLSGAKSRVQRARVKLRERLMRCCEIEFGPEGRAVAFRRRRTDSCESSCY